ncbi:MAG TPA: hypothetical protein VFP54_10965 [Acidimicrobiales bacterium]|nr:hypothetical protein [Acidimicrobiales bacterium]
MSTEIPGAELGDGPAPAGAVAAAVVWAEAAVDWFRVDEAWAALDSRYRLAGAQLANLTPETLSAVGVTRDEATAVLAEAHPTGALWDAVAPGVTEVWRQALGTVTPALVWTADVRVLDAQLVRFLGPAGHMAVDPCSRRTDLLVRQDDTGTWRVAGVGILFEPGEPPRQLWSSIKGLAGP